METVDHRCTEPGTFTSEMKLNHLKHTIHENV